MAFRFYESFGTCFQIASLACSVLLVGGSSAAANRIGNLEWPNQRAALPHEQGSSSVYQTRFDNVTWNNADWLLTTTYLDSGHYQSRAAVANGYIGISVAASGPFFEIDTPVDGDNINGWPLFGTRQAFATIGGFWDSQPTTNGTNFGWLNQYGGESVISGIPHWSAISISVGGHTLNASTAEGAISDFHSTLDLKRGVMNWAYIWTPSTGSASLNITYQLFTHKLRVNQAFVQLQVTSSQDINATISNIIEGDCAVRTTFEEKGQDGNLIYSSVKPLGIENVTAYIYAGIQGPTGFNASSGNIIDSSEGISSNQSSIGLAHDIKLSAGQQVTFTKYVGIASSDGFQDPKNVAKSAATDASIAGYDSSLESHVREWAEILTPDSVDDFTFPNNGSLPDNEYIVEQQVAAVVNPYYLLQNTIGQNALNLVNNASINSHSIAVGGLVSDSYAGLIFWDAEVWMQPGLVAAFPQASLGMANYRYDRFDQARRNMETAYQYSKNDTDFSPAAAAFPWTSGRFGNCTGTGPCFDYQYHLNGDIARSLANYWIVSGDTQKFEDEYFPIYDSIATLYSNLLERNGSQYSLTNMTDPVS